MQTTRRFQGVQSFAGNAVELVFFQGGIHTVPLPLLVFLWKLQIAILRDSKWRHRSHEILMKPAEEVKITSVANPFEPKIGMRSEKNRQNRQFGTSKIGRKSAPFLAKISSFFDPLDPFYCIFMWQFFSKFKIVKYFFQNWAHILAILKSWDLKEF